MTFIYLPFAKCCQIYSMVGVSYWPPQCWPVHLRWLTFLCYARAPELSHVYIDVYIDIRDKNINSQKMNTFFYKWLPTRQAAIWMVWKKTEESSLTTITLPSLDIFFALTLISSTIWNVVQNCKHHRIHLSNLHRSENIRYEIYKPIFELVVACTVCTKINKWSMNIK